MNYKTLTRSSRSAPLHSETARLGPGRAVGTSASLGSSTCCGGRCQYLPRFVTVRRRWSGCSLSIVPVVRRQHPQRLLLPHRPPTPAPAHRHSRTLRCRPTTCQTQEPAGLAMPPSAPCAQTFQRWFRIPLLPRRQQRSRSIVSLKVLPLVAIKWQTTPSAGEGVQSRIL